MDKDKLRNLAKSLVASGKGILAADESTMTMKKRLSSVGVESNPETNRVYRQILFTTPGIEEFISGVILFDETIKQKSDEGIPFSNLLKEKGVVPGIKVDKGTVDFENFPGEKITEGLDGLRERLKDYKSLGAEFTKWRAVFSIGVDKPTDVCIETNCESLARFAGLSQEADLLPIVEPEVLMDGDHSLEKCEEVTNKVLELLFKKLRDHRIDLAGILLKPNMVIAGKESLKKPSSFEVAEATLRCFESLIPEELPGIVFLSGGQSPFEATENLNEINKIKKIDCEFSFSFGRALQEPVLKAWQGKRENIKSAQSAFYKRAKLNSLARRGEYRKEMENE